MTSYLHTLIGTAILYIPIMNFFRFTRSTVLIQLLKKCLNFICQIALFQTLKGVERSLLSLGTVHRPACHQICTNQVFYFIF